MRCVVTGGCGFIGSRLCAALSDLGAEVFVVDPRFGKTANELTGAADDLSDLERARQYVRGAQVVFHLGASTDMTWKPGAQLRDLQQGLLSTLCLLEAMRIEGVRRMVFTSSSAVYGDLAVQGVDEAAGPLLPCSTYGAAKLAAEGYVSTYATLFEWQALILRLGNVIGQDMDRGVLFDLVRKLRACPAAVDVLGDGTQGRSYILVEELAALIPQLAVKPSVPGRATVLNVSGEGLVTTRELVQLVSEAIGTAMPEVRCDGSHRGWPGDVPRVRLRLERLRSLGVDVPSSREAAARAARGLLRRFAEEARP